MHHSHNTVKTKDVIGYKVKNNKKEHLGKVEEIMLDKVSGHAHYVVLSFGEILGMGGKFFAIPWGSLHFDPADDCFLLNVSKEKLEKAPGFDKDHWPDFADQTWGETIHTFYDTKPYWK